MPAPLPRHPQVTVNIERTSMNSRRISGSIVVNGPIEVRGGGGCWYIVRALCSRFLECDSVRRERSDKLLL